MHGKFPYKDGKADALRTVLSILLLLALGLTSLAQEKGKGKKDAKDKPRLAGPVEYGMPLNDLWYIQSSGKIKTGGGELSMPGVRIDGWLPAIVPSTVLGTLVQNNVYGNVFQGENLKSVRAEEFQVPWWYRREFILPAGPDLSSFRLELDGVNYRANVWINGKLVSDSNSVFGPFRRFSLDITPFVKTAEKNVLAIEVIPARKGEPGIGFVDWNPAPPDGNLGMWREARIRVSGDVSIENTFVQTRLDLKTLDEARLTVSAELRNYSDKKHKVEIKARLGSLDISKTVELMPKEQRLVVFTPENTPELIIKSPRIWWTHDLGRPELYKLYLQVKSDGRESDITSVRFGIREVSDYLTGEGHRGYLLNGKKLLVRGGGWTDDMFLTAPKKRLEAEIAYVRHMNLNALRFEGFWGSSEDIYDLCDENGILIMAGWSCQWEWEGRLGRKVNERFGGITSDEDMALVSQSWEDQVKWLRNHPSIMTWVEASDKIPSPDLEREYSRILRDADPTRPALVSAKGWTSGLSGSSGVKMLGPYDYVPPVYWYADKKNGGAFGFNTESGPGPQVPPVESLRKMFSEKDLWPIGEAWSYHCSNGMFKDLSRYNEAMERRLGQAGNVEDYAMKAQFLNYEGMRAMFEAFTANKGGATGVIQWMLNSAWPKLWWQLYDHYLMPNGAFYGARKACSPLHLIYDYGTGEVIAVNNTRNDAAGLRAGIRLYDLEMKELSSKTINVSLAADERKAVDLAVIPADSSPVHFLDLRLYGEAKKPVSINFYALSARPETLDEEKSTWYVTPVRGYADFTALEKLKPAKVKVSAKFKADGPRTRVAIDLENTGDSLAFQLELQVVKAFMKEPVLPVFLDDNYINLLPGETRRITGYIMTDDLGGDTPLLSVKGWNLEKNRAT